MAKNLETTDSELDHLRNRVDRMEEKASKSVLPWYRISSNWVSIIAFVVSFGSTILSYIHTRQQDIHSLRTELRGVLQRLSILPRENVEITLKYKSDPQSLLLISGSLNQENLILALQADDILRRLPPDQVSAIDFLAVGQALQSSRRFDSAIFDVVKASQVATGLDDDVGALRTLGNLEMVKGNSGEARKVFQSAIDIFVKYPGYDEFTKRTTNLQTELLWSGAEAGIREFNNANQHLLRAQDILDGIPSGPAGDIWRMQVVTFKQQLAQVQTNPNQNFLTPGQSLSSGVTSAGVATPPL